MLSYTCALNTRWILSWMCFWCGAVGLNTCLYGGFTLCEKVLQTVLVAISESIHPYRKPVQRSHLKVRTVTQPKQCRLVLCLEAQLYNCMFVAISLTVGSLA